MERASNQDKQIRRTRVSVMERASNQDFYNRASAFFQKQIYNSKHDMDLQTSSAFTKETKKWDIGNEEEEEEPFISDSIIIRKTYVNM